MRFRGQALPGHARELRPIIRPRPLAGLRDRQRVRGQEGTEWNGTEGEEVRGEGRWKFKPVIAK